MLAKNYDPRYHKTDYFLQPKLDGHRAIWTGKDFISRQGKPIYSVMDITAHLFEYFHDYTLDGELFSKTMTFQELTSYLRRSVNIKDIENTDIYYCVYDSPMHIGPYHKRFEEIKTKIEGLQGQAAKRIQLIPNIRFQDSEVNIEKLNIFGQDYEGTMYRDAHSLYEFGKRSSGLLKIKSFHDTEVTIVGTEPLYAHEKIFPVPANSPGAKQWADGTWYKNGAETKQDTLGALICKFEKEEVKVGTGFSEEDRAKLWKNRKKLIGKKATIKYQETSDGGVPRFPVFLRLREDV